MGCSASKPPEGVKHAARPKGNNKADGRVQSRPPSSNAASNRASGEGTTFAKQKAAPSAAPPPVVHDAVPPSATSKASMDVDMALVDKMLEISSKSEIIRSGAVNIPDVSTVRTSGSPDRFSTNRQSSLRAPETPPHHSSSSYVKQHSTSEQVDPWANLQSAYAIRDTDSPDKQDVRSSKLTSSSIRISAQRSVLGSGQMVVLDEDVETRFSSQPLYQNQKPARGGVLAAKPVQGGWSQGAMAKAGELMVGRDEEMLRLSPPSQVAAQGEDDRPSRLPGGLGERIKAMPLQSDLGMEDIEDVDALLEQDAAKGALKPNLAAKLAAFEALAGDDDD